MKNLIKYSVLSFVLVSGLVQASDFKLVTDTGFSVTSQNAAVKLENSLLTTEGILKHFNPAGVEIKKKVVNGNSFEYLVVKKFLGVAKEVEMIGSMNFERRSSGCLFTETAYLGVIDFTGSQPVITDNIESFTMLLCVSDKSASQASVRVKSTLNYKGQKLGFIVEKFVIGVIKDQVDAIIYAIKADVTQSRLKR